MSKVKSQLRYGIGMWPESREPAHVQPLGLTVAARRVAMNALGELSRLGVVVTLDDEGRARFRATKALPPAAKRIVETHADVIEAHLRESASRRSPP
jgi:hypothetical protein